MLIDVLRGRQVAKAFVEELTDRAIPCCSVVSVAEIYAGMRPEESETTAELFDGVVVFPITRAIAEVAGHFKRRAKSRKLELADCLIAATAFIEGASVATGNAKDYPMPEITVLPAPR
ncbi:MAG: type II toxin-antitoxin system VapC family toxin [Nitrospirota bacterium]|nr:type II toxin-antitoxin system VapC family toxin [Nitrospirota bacterium]MDE3242056.1 type II toxin-antitoxin system VapC family toxin [Nitrospirota bacterium]